MFPHGIHRVANAGVSPTSQPLGLYTVAISECVRRVGIPVRTYWQSPHKHSTSQSPSTPYYSTTVMEPHLLSPLPRQKNGAITHKQISISGVSQAKARPSFATPPFPCSPASSRRRHRGMLLETLAIRFCTYTVPTYLCTVYTLLVNRQGSVVTSEGQPLRLLLRQPIDRSSQLNTRHGQCMHPGSML